MIIQNEKGIIEVAPEVLMNICGYVATKCFGVKGMAYRNIKEGFVGLLKRENMSKGVQVFFDENKVSIELHIIVEHGVNINTVAQSIMSEISYNVSRLTRMQVDRVNVCVDSIMV